MEIEITPGEPFTYEVIDHPDGLVIRITSRPYSDGENE